MTCWPTSTSAAVAARPRRAPAPAAPPTAAPPARAEAPAPATQAAPAPAAAARPASDEVIPFDNIRRRTAEHMVRSKATSPHVLTAVEVDFERVEQARTAAKADWKAKEGFSLTYLPFVARAVCDALAEFPRLNASVDGDSLVVHGAVNLGIAVDMGEKGLIVPVVKAAEGKRLRQIAREVRDLAERARNKKLAPDDVAGGTFTITNPGPFGTLISAPVINQPQVAILSTDGVRSARWWWRRPRATPSPSTCGDSGHVLGPPGQRRRLYRGLPQPVAGDHRDPRLVHRARVTATSVLSARWLGRVSYREAHTLQRALHARSAADHLLLLEHPHVYTLGRTARAEHLLVPPAEVGAELEHVDRGGDVTYHGPGQLVGYPILTLPHWRDGLTDVVAYVRRLEEALIDALAGLGVDGGRRTALPACGWTGAGGEWASRAGGEWAPRKIAAIGVKVTRGRTMHGFALNVDPDLGMFSHIVPCGIRDRGVTSLRRILGRPVEMRAVVDAVTSAIGGDVRLRDRRTPGRRLARASLRPVRLHPSSRGHPGPRASRGHPGPR